MTMRRAKRYTLQTFKEKEQVKDPYLPAAVPRGYGVCPSCQAVYYHKRWSLPTLEPRRSSSRTRRTMRHAAEMAFLAPHPLLCPACRKIREGYAQGFVSLRWDNWEAHQKDLMGLIRNEETRARRINPLERIITMHVLPDGAEIETTTERLAQRIGRQVKRAFHGTVQYKWSHKDKLVRVEWIGPSSSQNTRPMK
ncbi:MAG: ATPase [Nitrospirae bacterium]|nr:MAG: ATPase [Nitrospirota bacterium]